MSKYLQEAICISQICRSSGYLESSIMQENLRRSLKKERKYYFKTNILKQTLLISLMAEHSGIKMNGKIVQ